MNQREFLQSAATWLCVSALAVSALPAWGAVGGRDVRGQVVGDGQPLAGVLVSDGCRVVRTGTDGRFGLPVGADSGRFMFVTPPRGYRSERWYLPLEKAAQQGRADFDLRAVTQPDRFEFAFMTDMHLEQREVGTAKLRATIEELNRRQPAPAFLWAQGDICLQGKAGQSYLECLRQARMPLVNGAGNHEMLLPHQNPRDEFEALFGPTYYSFDWGPVHCIMLDGNKPIPQVSGWKAVHGAVEGRELAWLERDLAAQPAGTPIIVGVHIPIVSSYPERRQQSPQDAPYWEMTNREALTRLLSRFGVRLVLQGHMHENERTTIGGVEYVSTISICGSWWQSKLGFERGVDGCPRGYRIVSVDGRRVTHRYQSSGESRVAGRGEFLGLDKPRPASAESAFVFNDYDAPHGSRGEARIDGGPWQPMPGFAAPSAVTAGLSMPHHFRLLADTRALPLGKHTIEARVTWPDGSVVTEAAPFELAAAR